MKRMDTTTKLCSNYLGSSVLTWVWKLVTNINMYLWIILHISLWTTYKLTPTMNWLGKSQIGSFLVRVGYMLSWLDEHSWAIKQAAILTLSSKVPKLDFKLSVFTPYSLPMWCISYLRSYRPLKSSSSTYLFCLSGSSKDQHFLPLFIGT